jgi:hypothetical protein
MSRHTEQFLKRKAELFLEIRNVLKAVEESTAPGQCVATVQILADQFNKECQTAWYGLMAEELTLHEQLEVPSGLFAHSFNGKCFDSSSLGMVW